VGDSKSLAAQAAGGNSESVTEVEMGEVRRSRGGGRQLTASKDIRGQFLLPEESRWGMILLILLGGRQK